MSDKEKAEIKAAILNVGPAMSDFQRGRQACTNGDKISKEDEQNEELLRGYGYEYALGEQLIKEAL